MIHLLELNAAVNNTVNVLSCRLLWGEPMAETIESKVCPSKGDETGSLEGEASDKKRCRHDDGSVSKKGRWELTVPREFELVVASDILYNEDDVEVTLPLTIYFC